MTDEIKRLYRSRIETRLAGVCGGIGLFFRIDPVLVRLVWVAATLMTGVVPGILAYLAAWILVPQEPPSSSGAPVVERVDQGAP